MTSIEPSRNDTIHKPADAYKHVTTDFEAELLQWQAIARHLEATKPSTPSPMEEQFHSLAVDAVSLLISKRQNRILIAVGGTPGSGKTSLAVRVTDILNQAYNAVVSSYQGRSNTGLDRDEIVQSQADASDKSTTSGKPGNTSEREHIDSTEENKLAKQAATDEEERHSTSTRFASSVPMDGYHYTRKQLDAFDDPEQAHARRGAHWTFDAEGVVAMAQTIHDSATGPSNTKTLYFPAFDHALKDPQPEEVVVSPCTRIVILEGLYTLLKVDPWTRIAGLADLTWCMQVPLDVTRLRLARRHLAAGIVSDLDAGFERVDKNDAVNAELIMANSVPADRNVDSIHDESMAT